MDKSQVPVNYCLGCNISSSGVRPKGCTNLECTEDNSRLFGKLMHTELITIKRKHRPKHRVKWDLFST